MEYRSINCLLLLSALANPSCTIVRERSHCGMYKRNPDADPAASKLGSKGGLANTAAQRAARQRTVLAATAGKIRKAAERKATIAVDKP